MHKWILHRQNGPAVYYKCLRCKRYAFYLDYYNKHLLSIPPLGKINKSTLLEKFKLTVEYIENRPTKIVFYYSSSYYNKKDFNELEDVVNFDCNELDVKDIIT
jgi:hypothetical protein